MNISFRLKVWKRNIDIFQIIFWDTTEGKFPYWHLKMILSRSKPAISDEKAEKEKSGSARKQVPTIEQFLDKRDYTGK